MQLNLSFFQLITHCYNSKILYKSPMVSTKEIPLEDKTKENEKGVKGCHYRKQPKQK